MQSLMAPQLAMMKQCIIRWHTAVLPKIPHSNCPKRVPNRPPRPRRGRFGTLLELLQCGIFGRTAVLREIFLAPGPHTQKDPQKQPEAARKSSTIASGGVMSTNSLYCEVVMGGFATKRHGWKEDLSADSIHASVPLRRSRHWAELVGAAVPSRQLSILSDYYWCELVA